MSKILNSPVPECPGTITINTAPTMRMVEAYMDAKYLYTIQVQVEGRWLVVDAENVTQEQIAERREKLFNAALAFVERWDIKGQPEHMNSRVDLNPQPYIAVSRLVSWFLKSIFDFCMSEREIPKVLSPESIDILQTPATAQNPQS